MGNDHPCQAMGIGTVKLKMYDGVVRTLSEVQNVSDLKKNLISLDYLDSKSHNIMIEGGILKVLSGALVMRKGKKEGNPYFFQGCTITRNSLVYTEEKEYLTRLWHK